jgi:dihydrofolate reductase
MKVTLLMALTADGKIARHADHFPDWTEKADKKLFRDITLNAGVVLMGSRTYDTMGNPLPDRKNIVLTRNPNRKSQTNTLVFTGDPPRKILADLELTGIAHAVLIGGATINSLFAMEDLIDEMILTYCPSVFGSGISLFAGDVSMDLELTALKKIGENSFAATYSVLRPHGLI